MKKQEIIEKNNLAQRILNNGKPTKRYLKLMEKINKAKRLSVIDIENLF